MSIKKTIAIASAKGGVGKSSITSLLAKKLSRDFSIGILDADIYGPNQHIIFDVASAKPEIIEEDHKKRFMATANLSAKTNRTEHPLRRL